MAARRPRQWEVWTVVFLGIWASGCVSATTGDVAYKFKAQDTCQPPAFEFDIQNITNGVWTFTETGQNCAGTVDGPNGTLSSCTYTMAFCQKLASCKDASMCVDTFNGTGNNQTVTRAQGGFITNPFRVTDKSSLNGGFLANFTKGGNYTKPDGSFCQLSAVITFECNRNQYWIPNGNTTAVPKAALVKVTFDKTKCQLQATMTYAGACITLAPATPIPESMTAGTVLIIIFFVALSVYFTCGILINLVRGFRGKDVLPQSEFWTDLPVLIADGCLFTCRCGAETEKTGYDSI